MMLKMSAGSRRRFVNLVTEKWGTSALSVSRINAEDHLFYQSTAELPKKKKGRPPWVQEMASMASLLSSEDGIEFRSTRSLTGPVEFLPLFGPGSSSDSKILCADKACRAVLYDAGSCTVEPMPCHNGRKGDVPFSLSAARADAAPDPSRADALYVLDKVPLSRKRCNFEVLLYGGEGENSDWHWQPLPPPPFIYDRAYQPASLTAGVVLDGGSTVCFSSSAPGVGTYCFDTASHDWTKAGCGRLPFFGTGVHVPELDNLCFGIANDEPHHLCAATMAIDGGPELRQVWRDLDPPQELVSDAFQHSVYGGWQVLHR